MTTRQGMFAAVLVAALVSPPAEAQDRQRVVRLGRVLDRLEQAGAPPQADAELIALIGEVEQENARHRAEFDAAASRRLPSTSRERLERARAAFDEGHGRLLSALRVLVGTGSPADRAAALVEARDKLRKIEASARREPLSAGALNVRTPEWTGEPQSAALDAAPVGEIPALLKNAAAQLAGPVEVYEYVRGNIRPEFYHGVMKGPVETFLEQSGNDADTAALLVVLLRAKGFEARYVRGTAVVAANALTAATGTSSVERALRVLARAAIPHEAVLGAAGVVLVKWERTWVEAYLPYSNYRGAQLDADGKLWVPLDAAFKPLAAPAALDIAALGFDARQVFEDYLAGSDRRPPVDFVRQRASAFLAQQRPGTAYSDVLNTRGHVADALSLLPSTLPFAVEGRPEAGYDLEPSLRHTLRVVGEADGLTVLDVTLPVSDVLGRRLTLSYEAFSNDDEGLARQFGGIHATPPYLIDLRPVLKVGGVRVASGSAAIGRGVKFTLRLDLRAPGTSARIENTVIAGNLIAIGLGGRRVTAGEARESQAAEILSARAWSYLARWNAADEELASLFHVVPVRPTVSACLVFSDVQTEYAGGDPLFPLSFEWKGIAIDADLRSTAPAGVASAAREKDFLLLSGLQGSVLENKIFEDDLHLEAVGTAKALQLAREHGVAILELDAGNVGSLLPGLPLDPGVKTDIEAAVARGRRVRVPERELTHLAWHGVGYLLADEVTGETGWQLQGGHSGGVTAPGVIDIPDEIKDPLIRQREDEGPGSAVAAKLERFLTRDFQFGTVAKELPKPLKVLATDEDGLPVKGAAVTFEILGGGGSLIEPQTGAFVQSLTAIANDRGEAEVRVTLGTLTSEIPRFVQEEGEKFANQVGLNVVSARSGSVVLQEAFSAFGKPDDRFDGTDRYVTVKWVSARQTAWDGRLEVGGAMDVSVTDQHGNPISNWPIVFRYQPLPEQMPPPDGWFLLSGPTETPAVLLSRSDFLKCLQANPPNPSPIKGECLGEAETVTDISSRLGAGAVAILGDSPFSRYKFDVGTVRTPGLLAASFGTAAYLCPQPPGASSCLGEPKRPDVPIVSQGQRAMSANDSGQMIEAYPPSSPALLELWATALYEEAIAEEIPDPQAGLRYRARGLGKWRRERLTNSEFVLEGKTPGTSAPPSLSYSGNGYRTDVTLGPAPQLNVVQYTGKHRADVIKYLPGQLGTLDPAFLDPATHAIRRVPAEQPIEQVGNFEVWGARGAIVEMKPAPLVTTAAATVAETTKLKPLIEPAEWKARLAPRHALFEIDRLDVVEGQSQPARTNVLQGVGLEEFMIPAGVSLPHGTYEATLRLPRGITGQQEIRSAPFAIAACPLLSLTTPVVTLSLTVDPANGTTCGQEARVEFVVCRDALVTLLVDGQVVSGGVDGAGSPTTVSDLPLAAGTHRVSLSANLLGPRLDAEAPMLVRAVAQANPALQQQESGIVINDLENRSVLPVGHTFVKGVDLLDGHVVQQATDIRSRGRHLALEISRSYSSAGHGPDGLLGAGWSFSADSRVMVGSCSTVVKTADGSSQVFTPTGGGHFKPQRGYHSKLFRNADGSFDFTDKAGVVHHFREPEDPTQPNGARRVEWIREPHGDELRFSYDNEEKRLVAIQEWHPESGVVRTLTVTYLPETLQTLGVDRIQSVTITPNGISATYGYDTEGNLTSATTSTGLAWTYSYVPFGNDVRKQHQLAAVVDPNGSRIEYEYFADDDKFPGETVTQGGVSVVLAKHEFVKVVREFPEKQNLTRRVVTQFVYDYGNALLARVTTIVRDPRGHETTYLLNGDGSPLRIEEPEGRTTEMTWAPNDIFKTEEKDANQRITTFGHDDRGNLTRESIQAPGLGPVETHYEYDARFNKLKRKVDAENRETAYDIDPANGDLLSVRDAVGNLTVHSYDAHGRLHSTQDPRGGRTEYQDHQSFGDPRRVIDALGNVTVRAYDDRGRLRSESDSLGRSRSLDYDDQDRVTSETRHAGGPDGNADVTTGTQYYPLGQILSQTNGNDGTTAYVLDGMNRVTETSTPSGTIVTGWNDDNTKMSEQDRRGILRQFGYDGVHRLKTVRIARGVAGEAPTNEVASYEYDKVGNKTLERDHARRVTGYEYDGLYRVKRKILAQAPYDETYRYDKVGNQLSATDANGKQTRMAYDGLNRVTEVHRDPEGLNLTVITEYNEPSGSHVNKSAEHDTTRGLRTEFLYDALNRETDRKVVLLGEGDPATVGAQYLTHTTYHDGAHSLTVTDPRGNHTELKLDGLDRPVERTQKNVEGRDLRTQILYDGLSNKVKEIDPEGREKGWFYDTQGRLTSVFDFAGTTEIHYDGEGLKTSQMDRRQTRTLFTYDDLGRPRTERLAAAPRSGVPWSREISYVDAPVVSQRREKDARGYETVFHLDALNRVVKAIDPDSFFTETTWDGVNRVAERDKRGNWTFFGYDAVNRLAKTTDPVPFSSQTVETTYLDTANRKVDKDRRGHLTVTQTDPLGRVVSVTRSGVRLERHEYDANGSRTLSEDAEGKKTAFVYDAANRLLSRTDGFQSSDAATTRYVVDGSGNKLKEVDPRSTESEPSMRYAYDRANRLTDTFDGEGNHTHFVLDGEGNRTSLQEPEGQVTSYDYDELGKLLKVTQPATMDHGPPETRYDYDPNRNRIRQLDARGKVVEMSYDKLNRLDLFTQKDAPEGDLITDHDYDENGNEKKLTDPKGQGVISTFDELNRLKTRTYAPLASEAGSQWRRLTAVEYGYDANGNPTSVVETQTSGTGLPTEGLETIRNYDALDRLEMERTTLPQGGTKLVGYGYYGNGTRKSVTDPDGLETRYTYDGQNRLKTATTGFGTGGAGGTEYTYHPDDLLDEVRYPNGVVAKHGYDKADRLLSVRNTRAAVVLSSFLYFGTDASGAISYDRNGNRLIQVETNGGTTETTRYGYDAMSRLQSIAYPTDVTYPNGRNVSYHYDAVGNRVRETETNNASAVLSDKEGTFDALNRLSSLADLVTPSQSTSFGYDKNGNQTSKTVAGLVTTNIFDPRDKLIESQQGSSILARFEYCYDGKRIKKIGLEGIRQYVYDQTSLLNEYDDAGLTVAKYDYGSDRLLSLFRRDEPKRYFHLDGLRSVTNLTDGAGNIAASYHLDAWGNYRFPAETDASKNRFGFTGYELDKETGLYNAKARYFDPQLGRFLTQDSYLGQIDNPPSLHRFFYGNANPLRYLDLTGHAGDEAKYFQYANLNFAGQTVSLIKSSESVDVVAAGGRGREIIQQTWQQLAPLNQAAERGMRGAGIAAQTSAAIAFGATPAGAYLALRAADEFQAFGRELWSGEPTQSEAQHGLQIAIQHATGTDRTTAGLGAGGALVLLDAGVGFGGVRNLAKVDPVTRPLEGIAREAASPIKPQPMLEQLPTSKPRPAVDDPAAVPQSKKRSVRKRDYPTREWRETTKRLESDATDAEGTIRCQSPTCEVPGGRALAPGEGTPQHNPALVKTHNEIGYNTDQTSRTRLYNETADSLHCIDCQRKEGGQTRGTTYREDTGPSYQPKPPKPVKREASGQSNDQ